MQLPKEVKGNFSLTASVNHLQSLGGRILPQVGPDTAPPSPCSCHLAFSKPPVLITIPLPSPQSTNARLITLGSRNKSIVWHGICVLSFSEKFRGLMGMMGEASGTRWSLEYRGMLAGTEAAVKMLHLLLTVQYRGGCSVCLGVFDHKDCALSFFL